MQIDDRVSGIMAGLNSQVQSQKAALDALTDAVNEAKTKGPGRSHERPAVLGGKTQAGKHDGFSQAAGHQD